MALVLLPGGPGYMALDAKGCARKLEGNSLVRSRDLFHAAGFVTALVDAPSDHRGEDGLGGFRLSAQHADDIGKVIAEVRERTKLPVWLVGTSRGAISAANAASRLTGPAAPDGLVLTSAVTSGSVGGLQGLGRPDRARRQAREHPHAGARRRPRRRQMHPHAAKSRRPHRRQNQRRREQTVTVTGGPGIRAASASRRAEGRTPHGFIDQEAEVAAGIVRFIRGGQY